MKNKNLILQGTIYLTIAGFISRILGFFYRIFLSKTLGATNLGIFQLSYPICGLCYSLTTSGIHTSISRYVSSNTSSKSTSSIKILYAGLILSVIPTCILAFFIHTNSDFIATYYLHEAKCSPIVSLLAISLPFSCIHSCINAYLYGKKTVIIPAISQLIEQIARIGVVYLIYYLSLQNNTPLEPSLAAYGIIIEEIIAILFTLTVLAFSSSSTPFPKDFFTIPHKLFIKIFKFSFPLTLNRMTLMLMQTLETILIPQMLHLYGLSNNKALATYGILTGMAQPLILFPSAITNSLSVMLLPAISEAQSSKNLSKIENTISSTIKYCCILGIFFTSIFFIYGNKLGTLLFSTPESGIYIKTLAWICPFLYLSSTLLSILNGLGKNTFSLLINCSSLFIRIIFTYFFIPVYGIKAYLCGLLISQLFVTLSFTFYLKRLYNFTFSISDTLLKPTLFILLSYFVSSIFMYQLVHFFLLPEIVTLALSAMSFSFFFAIMLIFFNVISLK